MATPLIQDQKPNMFANWGQNPVGNWNKVMDKSDTPAAQWATETMQKANIPDPTAPQQPAVVPYAQGTNVVQQPVVQQAPVRTVSQPQSTTYHAGSNNPQGALDYLLTSREDEEKLRKASVQRQRIMAVADALRNIGNIYYTVNGAVPQQFNNPVEDERKRYLQEKAIRDQNNMIYHKYQQAKAEQEQKAKQWEQQYKLNVANAAAQAAYRQEQARIAAANAASQDAYRRGNLARQEAADKARNEYNERKLKQQISHQNRMAGIAGMNAQNNKRRTDAYVERMKNGGVSGGKGQNTIYSRRGYLTKQGASDHDLKSIYDNMYEWGKNKYYKGSDGKLHPYIDEGGILSGIAPDILGGKKISDASKREAVNKMLMEHDDAAVQLHTKHGFDWHEQTPYDPYGKYAVDSPDVDDDDDEDFESYAR